MSNNGLDGAPIDSSWLATYQDQGLVGDVLDGLVLLSLLLVALISARGPGRAVALFLVVYCTVSSFTKTGLGQPSTYLLDLAVAMSVLMQPLTSEPALTQTSVEILATVLAGGDPLFLECHPEEAFFVRLGSGEPSLDSVRVDEIDEPGVPLDVIRNQQPAAALYGHAFSNSYFIV